MNDQPFRQLLVHFGLDWAGYRKVRKGVKKRVARHMTQLGLPKMSEYLAVLDADPLLRMECERRLTVAVSRFFRDRQLWEHLRMLLFSDGGIAGRPLIRVWSAGCAGGEEVYSLKILEAEQRLAGSGAPVLSILATDKNPENLLRAKRGAYPPSSLKELPPGAVSTFFDSKKGGRRFVVLPLLTENIQWQRHDLLDTPPQGEFHALFLRNSLLTYHGEQTRKTVLAELLKRLSVGGFLVVGSHERLPDGFGFMCRDKGHPSIWWRTVGGR